MRLTVWHKGTEKPVRDGVYQRKYPMLLFCKFSNGIWYCFGITENEAKREKFESTCQDIPWRGITKDGK